MYAEQVNKNVCMYVCIYVCMSVDLVRLYFEVFDMDRNQSISQDELQWILSKLLMLSSPSIAIDVEGTTSLYYTQYRQYIQACIHDACPSSHGWLYAVRYAVRAGGDRRQQLRRHLPQHRHEWRRRHLLRGVRGLLQGHELAHHLTPERHVCRGTTLSHH